MRVRRPSRLIRATARSGPRATLLAIGGQRRGARQKIGELAAVIRWLLRQRPRVVLEVGTWNGGTLWAWCRAAAPDALIISVDLPVGDYVSGSRENLTERLQSFAGPHQTLHLLRMDSHDPATLGKVKDLLDGRRIEFAFIDGDHSYEGVRSDVEMYAPLVDGFVAFHDVTPENSDATMGVNRLWRELTPGRESWEFRDPYAPPGEWDWGGIGVVRVESGLSLQ